MACSTWPARHWVSARSLGVGPLVGRRPARWALARSLGVGPLVRASAFDSPQPARWGICYIMLPPNRVDIIRPGVGGNSPVHAVKQRFINVCWGIGCCRGSHNPPATPSGGIYQQSFRRASSTPFPPNCGVGIRRNVRVILPDSWQEETQPLVLFDAQLNPRRLSRKAPVQDISSGSSVFRRWQQSWLHVIPIRVPNSGLTRRPSSGRRAITKA